MPEPQAGPLVGIVMGSQSDWETMRAAAEVLDELGVPHEVRIVSAHRTPDRLFAYAEAAAGRGLMAIIAGAGGAAHLPGMLAAKTRLPVLGVPVASQALGGLDSLLSIVQMPRACRSARWRSARPGRRTPRCSPPRCWRPATRRSPTGSTPGGRRRPRRWRRRRMAPEPLPPGSRIGILGGGQLGRMLAMAAARLGMRVHVFEPAADPCAAQVANAVTRAGYDDLAALARLRRRGRRRHLRVRERRARRGRRRGAAAPVRPGRRALEVAQDRLAEKAFLAGLGLAHRAPRRGGRRRRTSRRRWRGPAPRRS